MCVDRIPKLNTTQRVTYSFDWWNQANC